jgi:hypothetical protein
MEQLAVYIHRPPVAYVRTNVRRKMTEVTACVQGRRYADWADMTQSDPALMGNSRICIF